MLALPTCEECVSLLYDGTCLTVVVVVVVVGSSLMIGWFVVVVLAVLKPWKGRSG